MVVSTKRRRTHGMSSIGRTRYDKGDRIFYDAIKENIKDQANE